MGRIKTKLTKRVALKIFNLKPEDCKEDFTENKVVVNGLATIKSKKLLNVIAGYVTRLKKNHKEY
jgi:ribosomal protein S17E